MRHQLPPIGERLKRLREEAGLTQRALAERADTSLSVVFQLEQGAKKDPRLRTLVALADALGISMDQLIGRETEPAEPEPPTIPEPWKRPRRGKKGQ